MLFVIILILIVSESYTVNRKKPDVSYNYKFECGMRYIIRHLTTLVPIISMHDFSIQMLPFLNV